MTCNLVEEAQEMAVRKFRIRVNGVLYEVEAEEVKEASAPRQEVSAQPAPVREPKASAEPARKPAAVVSQDGETIIEAPLPGSVLDVKVQEGSSVEVGQVLVILEAMKMENEVTSPVPGRVKSVKVQKGSAVDANDVLLVIDRA